VQDIRNSARLLALYYKGTGQYPDGASAAAKAVDDIVNQKYDITQGVRVPKAIGGDNFDLAEQAFRAKLDNTNVGFPPAAQQNEKLRTYLQGQDADSMVRAAKAGQWVTNRDGKGVTLMSALKNGAYIPAYDTHGNPIGFNFSDIPSINAASSLVTRRNDPTINTPGMAAAR
jgi:hypothetical protein